MLIAQVNFEIGFCRMENVLTAVSSVLPPVFFDL